MYQDFKKVNKIYTASNQLNSKKKLVDFLNEKKLY